MMHSPALEAIAGVVHGFGARHDDMATLFPAYWPQRPIQHERHGTRIAIIERAGEDCGEADGMFTELPGAMLAIATADCAPVLLARRDGRAVAVLHVGWRGALAGIVQEFGLLLAGRAERPGDWTAAVGPTAGPCCYEVSAEIIDGLRARDDVDRSVLAPGSRQLDLARLVASQLAAAGIGAIDSASACTMCERGGEGAETPGFTFHCTSMPGERVARSPGIDVQWSVIAIAAQ